MWELGWVGVSSTGPRPSWDSAGVPIWELEASSQWVVSRYPLGGDAQPPSFYKGLQYICYRIFEFRGPVGHLKNKVFTVHLL